MKKFLFILCFLSSIALASPMQLKEGLSQAVKGSYLVIEQDKTCTLIFVREHLGESIVLEEISVPAATFAKQKTGWKLWLEKGAQGHTSWIVSQISLRNGKFEEAFSYTRQGWIDMSEAGSFFTTLLNLPFEEVTQADRRRVGLPPGYRRAENRPIWNPRLVVEGAIVANVSFTAFRTRWPADGTELSRKKIEIYLPDLAADDTRCPLYFPYWLEVDGKYTNVKVRVIDSGMNARSPKPDMPRRPIHLIGIKQIENEGLAFYIKSPAYYGEFFVIAQPDELCFGAMAPIVCQTIPDGDGQTTILVSQEELYKLAEQGCSTRFLLAPKINPSCQIESPPIDLTFVMNNFSSPAKQE